MEDNVSNAINKLQDMLSSEEGKKDLENMMNSLTGGGQNSTPAPAPTEVAPKNNGSLLGGLNPDILNTVQGMISSLQSDNGPGSNLLQALKPYLSVTRHGHVDTALKIISLTKLPGMIKLFRR